MRYSLLFFSVFLAVLSSGCEKAVDPEKEKAAIIEVINQETDTYLLLFAKPLQKKERNSV